MARLTNMKNGERGCGGRVVVGVVADADLDKTKLHPWAHVGIGKRVCGGGRGGRSR